ncbi:hypothetical protein B296_00025786 [Ensete ventricosum]|uniref:RRM domain-containing protein n=1 Tax=Ensete ventricosum TaxID=4639 RepID=A0A427A267_ENSVE|nr:hypothetical protein B296_00025786 [Ensete ventricosum]
MSDQVNSTTASLAAVTYRPRPFLQLRRCHSAFSVVTVFLPFRRPRRPQRLQKTTFGSRTIDGGRTKPSPRRASEASPLRQTAAWRKGGGGGGGGGETGERGEERVKLFVGQVPKHMTEDELLALFKEVALVDEVSVIKDKVTKASRGPPPPQISSFLFSSSFTFDLLCCWICLVDSV